MPQPKSKRTRYTPPPAKKAPSSPLWVPVAMFTMMLTGVAVVITNYLGLLPQGASNNYLFVGLGLLVGGFIASTQYR